MHPRCSWPRALSCHVPPEPSHSCLAHGLRASAPSSPEKVHLRQLGPQAGRFVFRAVSLWEELLELANSNKLLGLHPDDFQGEIGP